MTPEIFKEVNNVWKDLTKEAEDKELKFEIEIHKKLLNFFQVGDYYYYIFNLKRGEFELVSKEVTDVLGYEPNDINTGYFFSLIHPEDQPYMLKYEQQMVEFFKKLPRQEILHYKFRYDYRIRKKDGQFIRILQQLITIDTDDKDLPIRTLGVHTDISHIKEDGLPVLSFVGLNGRPSYINAGGSNSLDEEPPLFTKREREVLALLIEGKTSEEISQLLFISKHTVDSHRKNLLLKTNYPNTTMLIAAAIKKGWV